MRENITKQKSIPFAVEKTPTRDSHPGTLAQGLPSLASVASIIPRIEIWPS